MVLDFVEQLLKRAQHDGSLSLDPNLDLFKNIVVDEKPYFSEWRRQTKETDVILSPDGRTQRCGSSLTTS